MIVCQNCGKALPDNSHFCDNCGFNFYSQTEASPHHIVTNDQNNEQNGAGLSIASMILGIISLTFGCCLYIIAFPCSVIGLILGIISLRRKYSGKGMALAGVIMCGISFWVALAYLLYFGSAFYIAILETI